MQQVIRLRLGDSFEVLRDLAPCSIGAVIVDPPYLISFMAKSWDATDGEPQEWHHAWLQLCYNALVPGGRIKAFSATRTFHRLGQAMRRVGFILVPGESLEAWAYGSGFPKSLNLSKAIDAHLGKTEEREVAATEEASQFTGWGTALKPAWEPFLVGRKPATADSLGATPAGR